SRPGVSFCNLRLDVRLPVDDPSGLRQRIDLRLSDPSALETPLTLQCQECPSPRRPAWNLPIVTGERRTPKKMTLAWRQEVGAAARGRKHSGGQTTSCA